MKKLLAALAALSLTAACTGTGGSFPAEPNFTAGSSVASLQNKAAQSLVTAWRAFDAILTAVELVQAAGGLQAGSPKALRLADAIDKSRDGLNAATAAVQVGNATNFTDAMARAEDALKAARAVLGE
jgi:fumarate hydratase class II